MSLKRPYPPCGLRIIAILRIIRGVLAAIFSILVFSIYARGDLWRHVTLNFISTQVANDFLVRWLSEMGYFIDDWHLLFAGTVFGLLACIRFFEALGLWFEKRWAEWFSLFNCFVYIGLGVIYFLHESNLLVAIIMLVNIFIAIYLVRILRKTNKLNGA